MAAQRFQTAVQQCEMHRLVGGHREKVGDEHLAQFCPETPGGIEREVDRRKFDMGQRMPQRDPAALRAAAPAHAVWRQQFG